MYGYELSLTELFVYLSWMEFNLFDYYTCFSLKTEYSAWGYQT